MLKVVSILICISGLPYNECNERNAVMVIKPDIDIPCTGPHAQMYLAQTNLTLDDTYIKWRCRR